MLINLTQPQNWRPWGKDTRSIWHVTAVIVMAGVTAMMPPSNVHKCTEKPLPQPQRDVCAAGCMCCSRPQETKEMTITQLTRCFYHWHDASNDIIRRFVICFMASSSNSSRSSPRQHFRRSCANVPLIPEGFISKLCRILKEPIGKMSLKTVPQSLDRFSKDFWKSHSGRQFTNTFPRFLILGFRSTFSVQLFCRRGWKWRKFFNYSSLLCIDHNSY